MSQISAIRMDSSLSTAFPAAMNCAALYALEDDLEYKSCIFPAPI